ncbi:hypothetical protein BpHYR1_047003 [Brachionus plicatilis]|uniref:Uncharacterized protein n=1 Tax=Brachionus plicatilis TaxID=10195 RepID=A0A3M7SDR8_BRAPC|nr:hypothetical protein BpHYR1_047003 [Brachionus plicatilis]
MNSIFRPEWAKLRGLGYLILLKNYEKINLFFNLEFLIPIAVIDIAVKNGRKEKESERKL